MTTLFSAARDYLRASLWPAPFVSLLIAFSLAGLTLWADGQAEFSALGSLITNDAETARSVLSVVATSMLTFTALVFTITIVVLQLAASQYSPRITRAFLRDRTTKITLSLFLCTFVYALLCLRSVQDEGDYLVPALSVGATYVLVFASLLVFPWYLNHVSQSIRISSIVGRLARQGLIAFGELDPLESHEPEADAPPPMAPPLRQTFAWPGPAGVLTHVSTRDLVAFAARHDALIVLRRAIGDFVPSGSVVAELRTRSADECVLELDDYLNIQADREPEHDLGLSLRHLVDVALRALSPGVNDPTTAVQAIDYLHELLRTLATRRLPELVVRDERGAVRLIRPRPSWDSLLGLAFDEIRRAGADQLQVSRRVLYALSDLYAVAPPSRRPPLEAQQRLWVEAICERIATVEDRATALQADPQGFGAAPV